MSTLSLECDCGAVKGSANNISPSTGNHVVCCCSDCQQFASFLKRDNITDQFGGSYLYQTSQAQVAISTGAEQLRCMRLSEKGLLRWYTGCCNTPIGNTMNAGMPFVGLFVNFIKDKNREQTLGPVRAYVQTQYALGTPDYPHMAAKFPLGITLRIMRKMLVWKIRGLNKPSVFFKENGESVSKPSVLS